MYIDDQPRLCATLATIMEKDFSGATVEFRLVVPAGACRWFENR